MNRLAIAIWMLLASGCDQPADHLPGTYTGTLDSSVTASRMANLRPNDDGGDYVADVTQYSSSSSSAGTRVVVRHDGEVHGQPTFTATLGEICEVPFQLLEGGQISGALLNARCRCRLDDEWVEGPATVSGSYEEGRLQLDVNVSYMGSEAHTGGCTHGFVSSSSP